MCFISLNTFIKKHIKLKKIKNNIYIYCVIRKKLFLFKKEELTRQYIIFLLKKIRNYEYTNILVEFPICINGIHKRTDILVIKTHQKPHILIECKSPCIKITQKTFDQISMYNTVINAPFLWISNGITNLLFKIDKLNKKYSFEKKIP
ncbi:type I restriction enzyme HsdR N-terminal domain-containing protein [Blattabacterium cuenoti]